MMPSGLAMSTISRVILMLAEDGVGSPEGVVVDEDESGRRKLKRPLHDLARIDGRVVDRAGLLHLVRDQRVALIEKQQPELLLFSERHCGAAVVEHRAPG